MNKKGRSLNLPFLLIHAAVLFNRVTVYKSTWVTVYIQPLYNRLVSSLSICVIELESTCAGGCICNHSWIPEDGTS